MLTLPVAVQQSGVNKDNAQTLELMLDGRVMTGLKARGPLQPDKDGKGSVLVFDLTRQSSNKDAWNALLATGYKRNINVGLSNGKPVDGVNATVFFDALPPWWWAIVLMMGAILVGFIVLAIKTDILRDGPPSNGKKLSFSLGRTQMAWWTFIIACSFLFIWTVTWDWTFPIPDSALVLMGISAATAMGSQLVDGNRNQRRQALVDQQRTLLNRVDQVNVALRAVPFNATDPLQAERTQKQAQLDDVNSAIAKIPPDFEPSRNFLTDILSEDDGISLHRFQFALWTVILGLVFAVAVYRSLSLPAFDGTLQALMGISASTYVGFKIPDPPK